MIVNSEFQQLRKAHLKISDRTLAILTISMQLVADQASQDTT
ncbi:hypothetical protein [Nostoc spongiaeforme]|nr:hypothetical protein [Nostoc spongiaeforme]